jgi:hypothetical protein
MASNEQDLQEFMALVREINLILEEKKNASRDCGFRPSRWNNSKEAPYRNLPARLVGMRSLFKL